MFYCRVQISTILLQSRDFSLPHQFFLLNHVRIRLSRKSVECGRNYNSHHTPVSASYKQRCFGESKVPQRARRPNFLLVHIDCSSYRNGTIVQQLRLDLISRHFCTSIILLKISFEAKHDACCFTCGLRFVSEFICAMPECPELHLASVFVNTACAGVIFSGAVQKSEVNKGPEVPFSCEAYTISATPRGKEVRLLLTPIKTGTRSKGRSGQNQAPMNVVFRFGMSGNFRFTATLDLPKHSHLRFYTNEDPQRVLSFVDVRRFGSWQPDGRWQKDRGPCVMMEYESFRWGSSLNPLKCPSRLKSYGQPYDSLTSKKIYRKTLSILKILSNPL